MADELNTRVQMTVRSANVMTVPIDDSLSIAGEAADAAAVGAALALKADSSAVVTISVDGQEADNQGVILLDATDIPLEEGSQTNVKAAIDAAGARTAEDIPVSSDEGAQSIADVLAESVDKKADRIAMSDQDGSTVAERIEALELNTAGAVKSVNGETPDDTGNVALNRVAYADNLLSSGSQNSEAEFLIRASGGDASISDGDARIASIRGRAVHSDYVAEVLEAVPSNDDLTVTINRETFLEAVSGSTTFTLTYTSSWSTDPANYGITVTGTPGNGDTIAVTYVQEERGTIEFSDPQAFIATGWNLYNREEGYARVAKYSETYGFRVGGTYTSISWSDTEDGAQTLIQVNDRDFDIPDDGYIFVSGANSSTEIYMTWSDWTAQANGGVHQGYSQSVVNLAGIMMGTFPDGLMAVGDVSDEISFADRRAYSRIERIPYSEEARAEAADTGRPYDVDTDYIYLVRDMAVETQLADGLGKYTVNGHGIEMIDGTEIAPEVRIVYSNDLKNKLERDVLTISQQSLTSSQKNQVRNNIGALTMNDMAGLMKSISYSYSYSISSSSNINITKSNLKISNPSGYTPVAVAAFNTGSQYAMVTKISIASDSIVSLANTRGSTTTGTFSLRLLFAKTSVIDS